MKPTICFDCLSIIFEMRCNAIGIHLSSPFALTISMTFEMRCNTLGIHLKLSTKNPSLGIVAPNSQLVL